MRMDGKKISFGFSKVAKKPVLQLNKTQKQDESSKIELIKYLEGQQIKLVEERREEAPLVIPLKDCGKTSAALVSLAKRRAVLLGEDDEPRAGESAPNSEQPNAIGGQIDGSESLDKRAENEILAELQAKSETTNEVVMVLPVVKPDELPLDGAKESTLDDYESIPIGKYGWAMLRGMGATEPPKSDQKPPIDNGPMQRPPGLGLGADKALKPKPLLELPEANEKLEIKKQAFVRILAGKYKDAYGQIEGFDHERGTIIVKLAIGGSKLKFQEFLCQPVSKKEYAQYSKCINKAKYEEYKKQENEHGQFILKKEDKVTIKSEKFERDSIQTSMKVKTETSDSKNLNDLDKRLEVDNFAGTSSSSRTNRFKSRSRSRSSSRSRKYSSKTRYDNDSLNNYHKKASESDRESDSTYEGHKSSKSKKYKKKHKRRYSHSNDSSASSGSDDTDNARSHRHKRDKKKKSKKKTKKSKRERSRTPTRRKR